MFVPRSGHTPPPQHAANDEQQRISNKQQTKTNNKQKTTQAHFIFLRLCSNTNRVQSEKRIRQAQHSARIAQEVT